MNRWKTAFFITLTAWIVSVGILVYIVINGALSSSYMRDGYADCVAHKDFLHAVAKTHLTRSAIDESHPKIKWSADGYERDVESKEFKVKFDKEGRYAASRFGSSTTENDSQW